MATPAPTPAADYWTSSADLAAGAACIERPMTAAEEVLTFRVGQPPAGAEKSAPAPALAPRHRTPATRVKLRAAPPAGWALTPKEK